MEPQNIQFLAETLETINFFLDFNKNFDQKLEELKQAISEKVDANFAKEFIEDFQEDSADNRQIIQDLNAKNQEFKNKLEKLIFSILSSEKHRINMSSDNKTTEEPEIIVCTNEIKVN